MVADLVVVVVGVMAVVVVKVGAVVVVVSWDFIHLCFSVFFVFSYYAGVAVSVHNFTNSSTDWGLSTIIYK